MVVSERFSVDPPQPATRSRAATRARLLAAASEVFAEVGLGEASVERICDRAGFTRGAFYSNFASKDEMFLELAGEVARERVAGVRVRVADLTAAGRFDPQATDASVIIRALDVVGDDRHSTLLMHEISIKAMRDAEFAVAYRAQEEEILAEVVQLMDDIVEMKGLALRADSRAAAVIILAVWTDAATRAAVSELDAAAATEMRTRRLSGVVELLLERPNAAQSRA